MHPGNADAGVLQPLIVPQFGLDLVAEGIVIARFVMDLLDHRLMSIPFCEIRISALAFPQQANDPIFDIVDRKAAVQCHIIHLVPSAASGRSNVKRGPSSPKVPLGRKPHFSRTL